MINLSCDTLVFPPRLLVWAGQGGLRCLYTLYIQLIQKNSVIGLDLLNPYVYIRAKKGIYSILAIYSFQKSCAG